MLRHELHSIAIVSVINFELAFEHFWIMHYEEVVYGLSLEFRVRFRRAFIGCGVVAVFVGFLKGVAVHIYGKVVYLIELHGLIGEFS